MENSVLKLSPSSATDFKSCPQLFKYRAIDRLTEPTSAAAARGSLVHAILERLFKEAPPARTPTGPRSSSTRCGARCERTPSSVPKA